jgi:dUTPase
MADTLKYCKVRKVKDPTRGTAVAAGIDFYIPSDIDVDDFTSKCEVTKSYPNYRLNDEYFIDAIDLRPGESVMIPSGIKMKVPSGYALVMMNKSGIGAKKQLDVLACVID